MEGRQAAKWIALKQRCFDLHGAIPPFADVQEQSHAKIRHEKRIGDLTRPRAEGGFGLDAASAPEVVIERRALERATKELQRLQQLKESRTARWNVAKQLEARTSDWLVKGGVPANCVLEVVEDASLSELLKKGERISDAVERFRHRLRELG